MASATSATRVCSPFSAASRKAASQLSLSALSRRIASAARTQAALRPLSACARMMSAYRWPVPLMVRCCVP